MRSIISGWITPTDDNDLMSGWMRSGNGIISGELMDGGRLQDGGHLGDGGSAGLEDGGH